MNILKRIAEGFKVEKFEIHKPSPAIADFNAIEDVIEKEVRGDAVANTLDLVGDAVPLGKLWIVTSVIAESDDGTTGRLYLAKLIGATLFMINSKANVPRQESVNFHSLLILDSLEKLKAGFRNCQGATDTGFLYYTAYQVSKY